jgi:hypothetical protein
VQPLTIGCLDMARSQFRFWWRMNAPGRSERPSYVVSEGDWLTLAERFGLAARVEDGVIR